MLHTPWIRFGYLFYIKYINKETKSKIKGSIAGAEFEWFLHNVTYDFTRYKDTANVNLGKTIFADTHDGISDLMKVAYLGSFSLIALIDLIINGGWK